MFIYRVISLEVSSWASTPDLKGKPQKRLLKRPDYRLTHWHRKVEKDCDCS